MEAVAGWVAPAATMIAAMMTAANLGARVTGWGFVVFTVGAVFWIVLGLASGQQSLVVANGFLLVVDVIGVWRWLGRRARYDDGAQAAVARSAAAPEPTLFPLSTIEGRPVLAGDGTRIGAVVDAMAACDSGRVAYLVVCEGGVGGVGERLHALDWSEVRMEDGSVATRLDGDALAARPVLAPDRWPTARGAAVG